MSKKINRNEYSDGVAETTKLDPAVSITLKGTLYKLEFTNRSVKNVFDDTGYNILQEKFDRSRMEDPKLMGSLVFRGLQKNHPDLDQDQADDLFTLRHYPYILDRLITALDMFMPDSEGEEKEPDPTQRSGATIAG